MAVGRVRAGASGSFGRLARGKSTRHNTVAGEALAGTAIDRTELNPTETVFMFLAFPWGLAEVICCLKTVKRRAIHDFIAGTVVIRVDLGIGHDQKQGSVEI